MTKFTSYKHEVLKIGIGQKNKHKKNTTEINSDLCFPYLWYKGEWLSAEYQKASQNHKRTLLWEDSPSGSSKLSTTVSQLVLNKYTQNNNVIYKITKIKVCVYN